MDPTHAAGAFRRKREVPLPRSSVTKKMLAAHTRDTVSPPRRHTASPRLHIIASQR
ncbi:Hypothetical protein A7982_05411 [Minicystis rosea]|nr:Hypothetical protein A7982_05411 [Minicystis rosea]